MIIVGAKGFAKEVLEILHQLENTENVAFFDDVNTDLPQKLYNQYPILTTIKQVQEYFNNIDNRFTIGLGNPVLRKKMIDKFTSFGGKLTTTISPLSKISNHDVNIGEGSNILMNSVFSNSVTLGKGCIVYYNAVITHDCVVGDYVQISPGATLLGRCKVNSYTFIGANATILPDITIGQNVMIAAGSVVTKNIEDNSVVMGVPARVVKTNEPLNF